MKRKAKSLVKTRMFLSYSLAFVFLLTMVFLFGYMAFSRAVTNNKLESHMVISQQMSKELDTRFERPLKIATQFNLSKWVERMMYMQKYPSEFENAMSALEVRTQSQQIKLMEVSAGFDEQIVLYFALIDTAISNYGKTTWADYCAYYGLAGPEGEAVDSAILKDNNQRRIIPDCSMRINGKMKKGLAFFQTIPINDIRSANVTLFYFLPLDTLADQALSYYHQKDVGIYLMTPDQVLTSLETSEGFITEQEDIQRLFAICQGKTDCVYDAQTKAYILALDMLNTSNKLLIVLPAQSMQGEQAAAAKTFLLIYVLVLLLALLFSNLLANRGYKPLKRLVTNISVDIRPQEGETAMQDEYAMVDLAMRSLLNQREHLDKLHTQQTPMVQKYLILQAIHNTQEEGREEDVCKALESILPSGHYSCFLLDATPQVAQEVLERFFENQEGIGCIDVKMAKYRLVVAGYPSLETASDLWSGLGAWAREHNASIGCSEDHTLFAEFRQAYQQAMTAIAYRYLAPGGGVIRHQEIRSREKGNVTLRAGDTAVLKYAIQQGERQQAVDELKMVSQRLIQEKRVNVRDYQAAMTGLGRQLKAQLQQGREEYPIKPACVAEDFANCQLFIEALSQWLWEQMSAIAGARIPSNEVLIADYIGGHIANPALSQAQVAEALGYTPSYFSRYFKEKFQQTYHDYVTARRIQLAKQLMDEGDYAVTELAEKTGFTNDASFRRVFKAREGMTPSQYQQQKNRG